MRRYPALLSGLLAFLTALAVLIPSLAPSIPGGHDSGEVMTCAIVLGIPHPPGYPLYSMLGHLWTYLPIGDLAYRLNLFSAFSLALAGGFLAFTFSRVTHPLAGWVSALLYCFAFSPWRQGDGAEVFALHLCLLSALLMSAVMWAQSNTLRARRWWMFWGCLSFGLAAAHHHTIVLAVPGVLLYMVLSKRERPWGITPWAIGVMLVSGFAPYAYLYVRARQKCAMNWGDCTNFTNLKDHILRKAYGSLALNQSSGTVSRSDAAQALAYFASLLRNQFPFPQIMFGAAGLAVSFSEPLLLLLFGWIFFIYGPGFALYSAQPPLEFYLDMVERFYSSSYIGAAGFIALGLGATIKRLQQTRFARAIYLMPLLVVVSVVLNWPACSQRGQYHPDDHILGCIDWLPKGAVLCVDGDLPAGEWDYYHNVIKYRPDVLGIFPGLLAAPWYRHDYMPPELGDEIEERFRKSGDKDYLQSAVDVFREHGMPVYCTSRFYELKRGQLMPEGLVYRYLKEDEPTPSREERLATARKALDYLQSRQRRGDYRMDLRNQTFWTRYDIGQWVRAYRDLSRELYPDDEARAEVALQEALKMDPGKSEDWVNLANLHEKQGKLEQAQQELDEALRHEPDMPLALEAKVRLNQAQGRPEEAQRYQQRLDRRRELLGQ